MIVRWKKVTALEYAAQWEGLQLNLNWNSEQHNWRVFVGGKRTKGAYNSTAAAMEAVEGTLNKLLARAAQEARAQQRASSTKHIARYPFRRSAGEFEGGLAYAQG